MGITRCGYSSSSSLGVQKWLQLGKLTNLETQGSKYYRGLGTGFRWQVVWTFHDFILVTFHH